jgi:hypothetical protein
MQAIFFLHYFLRTITLYHFIYHLYNKKYIFWWYKYFYFIFKYTLFYLYWVNSLLPFSWGEVYLAVSLYRKEKVRRVHIYASPCRREIQSFILK